MSDRRDQEPIEAALRASLSGIPRPALSGDFTARVVARVAAAPAPPRKPARAAVAIVLSYGLLAIAASAVIIARLPVPLFTAEAARALALNGALASPLLLLGPVRRSLLLLVGRC